MDIGDINSFSLNCQINYVKRKYKTSKPCMYFTDFKTRCVLSFTAGYIDFVSQSIQVF
ncbi:hypothetical protein EXN66_Car019736 [Channa argus]|uniref:Uncharacterized protein n=1 Tax=Channa argus TaxID=215402 RepID=A0A6G1QP93_CHAAH|nr:hypothetical protein EXN66_Car019736 [Channa argus]